MQSDQRYLLTAIFFLNIIRRKHGLCGKTENITFNIYYIYSMYKIGHSNKYWLFNLQMLIWIYQQLSWVRWCACWNPAIIPINKDLNECRLWSSFTCKTVTTTDDHKWSYSLCKIKRALVHLEAFLGMTIPNLPKPWVNFVQNVNPPFEHNYLSLRMSCCSFLARISEQELSQRRGTSDKRFNNRSYSDSIFINTLLLAVFIGLADGLVSKTSVVSTTSDEK